MYDGWIDHDFIDALAEVEKDDVRAMQLASIADHPFILNLKEKAIELYTVSLERISTREVAMKMSEEERAYAFAMMDWAKLTLDMIGESPQALEQAVDNKVLLYAKKAGIA